MTVSLEWLHRIYTKSKSCLLNIRHLYFTVLSARSLRVEKDLSAQTQVSGAIYQNFLPSTQCLCRQVKVLNMFCKQYVFGLLNYKLSRMSQLILGERSESQRIPHVITVGMFYYIIKRKKTYQSLCEFVYTGAVCSQSDPANFCDLARIWNRRI